MKKKLNEDLIIHCMEGMALASAIVIVAYMVNNSDQKKKEDVHFRYHVGVSER
jgi:hypothetical protein